jgi:hypothetical protein
MRFRPQLKAVVWGVGLALAAGPAMAGVWGMATQGDSGQGVDTVIGNGLNPTGLDTTLTKDPDGLGPYRQPTAHTPTGSPYSVPWAEPEDASMHGSIEYGYFHTGGDPDAAKLIEYRDMSSGMFINNFNFGAEDGKKYFKFSGGGVGRDDQYYTGVFGVYNEWRASAFYNEIPHVFTTTAQPIWSGINTSYMSLVPQLQFTGAVGATANANAATIANSIRTVVAATPDTKIELIRKKGGIRYDYTISDLLNFYANYTLEKRIGGRPWGQTGGGFPGPVKTTANAGNGLPVELVEPIDYDTQEIRTGLSFADDLNAFNVNLGISLFHDAIKQVLWEDPYVNPTATLNRHVQQFTTPPDNQAINLNFDYSRALEWWKGNFNTSLSYGKQFQNDNLQPYTSATGTIGANTVTEDNLAYWNSTVGPNGLPTMTRSTAGLHNDVSNAYFALTLNPTDQLAVNGKFRFNDFAQHNDYLACNPSLAAAAPYNTTCTPGNGSTAPIYGYLVEDGNFLGNVAPTSSGAGVGGKVRSFAVSNRQLNTSVGADYQLSRTLSLNANLEREDVNRAERERDWTDENKIKLGVVDRDLFGGTLRASYEYDHRTGSSWKMDAYMAANCANWYVNPASCQAGYINAAGTPATTAVPPTNGKFDLADRDMQILIGRYNYAFSETLDGMITGRYKDETYPQEDALLVGRQARKDGTISFELNYQPTTTTGGYATVSFENVNQSQWSIDPLAGASGCTEALYLAGKCNATVGAQNSIYQNLNFLDQFGYSTNERNIYLNIGVNHTFDTVLFNANYTYTNTRSPMNFWLYQTPAPGNQAFSFPDMVFDHHQLNLNATMPISAKASAHLVYMYDKTYVADWHYDGLGALNNTTGAAFYLDSNPSPSYSAQSLGFFLQYKL